MTTRHGTQPHLPGISGVQPLIKWAGGKRNVLNFILPLIPQRFNRYFEPFLGGGALFFALQPQSAYLSDKNADLIHTYSQVRDRPDAVIRQLRKLNNSEKDYYRVRASNPRSDAARAARLIYLVTLAFNGIYRVNLNGDFNVPYGQKTHIDPCDETRIHETSELLKNAIVQDQDFEKALKRAKKGDLIYLDPPYTVAHGNNGFIKYNAKIFSWEDQVRLARAANHLATEGCTVIVSNADHPSIRRLYKNFATTTFERYSVICASRDYRARITECLFFTGQKHRC
jgi:DNA adenine methylase